MYVYVYMYTYMYIYTCICVYMYICIHVYMYVSPRPPAGQGGQVGQDEGEGIGPLLPSLSFCVDLGGGVHRVSYRCSNIRIHTINAYICIYQSLYMYTY